MSIFSSLVPEAHPNHNVFDLSRRDIYSIKSAMITPVFVQHTIPNATYEITPVNQIEVSTMAKSNFCRMKQNLEYYFVPYSQLWKWFESFYYQRIDPVRTPSNEMNPIVPTNVPHVNIGRVLEFLYTAYISNLFHSCVSSVVKELGFVPTPEFSLERACDEIVFQSDFDIGSFLRTLRFSLDGMSIYELVDIHGRLCVEDVLRNLDLLGYGNFLSYFKELINNIVIPTISLEFRESGLTDMTYFYYVIRQRFTSIRDEYHILDTNGLLSYLSDPERVPLFGNLDLNLFNLPIDRNLLDFGHVSVFPVLAYLKVWSDNFRNVQYDDENYSFFYNMDYLVDEPIFSEFRFIQCLIPRYRLYRRDIVTGTYPNAQFGDVAVAGLQNPTSITATNYKDSPTNLVVNPGGVVNNELNGSTVNNSYNINTGISALAIRQAEALQRYREKNLRAGSRLTNQQNAFFGDRSRFLSNDYSQFLFSTDSDILIDSVVATGESDGINLGDKGAKSESFLKSNSFKFDSHDFGMIIGVQYVLPVAEYEAYGIDPQLIKLENGDFFHPDLQNLGLSPVYSSIITRFQVGHSPSVVNNTVLGFSAHDWEYKTAIDKVHGEFNSSNGIFGDYVTPRDSNDFVVNKLSNLYVSPNDLDNIFVTQSDTKQSSDHFKVNMYHQVKAVLPMSVTGLPY